MKQGEPRLHSKTVSKTKETSKQITNIDIEFLNLHNCGGGGLLTKTKTVSISNYGTVKKAQPIKVLAPKPGNVEFNLQSTHGGNKELTPQAVP